MDLMMYEEMLKGQERDVAGVGSVATSRPANLDERTPTDTCDLRVVEAGEVVSSFPGDAKLAFLDGDGAGAGLRLHGVEDFVGFLARKLELLDRFRNLRVGQLLGSVDHA